MIRSFLLLLLFDFIDCQGRPPVLTYGTCGQFAEVGKWGLAALTGAPYGRSVFCGASGCGFQQSSCSASAKGEAQARFGYEQDPSEPLGLAFRGTNGSLTIDRQTNFIVLGTIAHLNFPLVPNSYTTYEDTLSVVLQIRFSSSVVLLSYWNTTLQMENTYNEDNIALCQYRSTLNIPCPDALRVEKSPMQTFNFNNVDYTLKIVGFSLSASNLSVFTPLIAEEDARTETFLVASISPVGCNSTIVCGTKQYLAVVNNKCVCQCDDNYKINNCTLEIDSTNNLNCRCRDICYGVSQPQCRDNEQPQCCQNCKYTNQRCDDGDSSTLNDTCDIAQSIAKNRSICIGIRTTTTTLTTYSATTTTTTQRTLSSSMLLSPTLSTATNLKTSTILSTTTMQRTPSATLSIFAETTWTTTRTPLDPSATVSNDRSSSMLVASTVSLQPTFVSNSILSSFVEQADSNISGSTIGLIIGLSIFACCFFLLLIIVVIFILRKHNSSNDGTILTTSAASFADRLSTLPSGDGKSASVNNNIRGNSHYVAISTPPLNGAHHSSSHYSSAFLATQSND